MATEAEYQAAFEALKEYADKEIPFYERGYVTDEILEAIAKVAIDAAEKAKQ